MAQATESSSEDEADDERDADEAAQDSSDAEDEVEFDPLTFPLHRATLPPVVHFPAAEASPSESGIPRSLNVALYMPWPASSASAQPPVEEDLMSEDTDTDALVEDLLDEEQLDEHDQRLEEACEESLWIEFGAVLPLEPHSRKKRKRLADDDGEDESDT
ncbi:hypothetical protein FOMPIDRAFT_1021487 [Fomitopsis schrenkii]|uniref:Uncharacterized protein n=1 Tax=Fomitopsis schrenkii TaxID=2126942 RepID=S8ELU9_FOMSC|nr:hypothetical protein FOMPIDRAFT_1021487 [Fomitopsis schrenkii]